MTKFHKSEVATALGPLLFIFQNSLVVIPKKDTMGTTIYIAILNTSLLE